MRVRVGLAAAIAVIFAGLFSAAGAVAQPQSPFGTPPVASFTATPTGGLNVSFDASASTDPNTGATMSYQWDFGDLSGPQTTTKPTIPHIYAAAGTYTVTLTVADDQGNVSTPTRQTITIGQPPTASSTAGAPDTVGTPITFDASTSGDPNTDGSITNYHWDFGDGTAPVDTTSSAVQHTYTAPGSYTATLTVTDAESGTATTTRAVTIGGASATASISFSPTSPAAGTAVAFSGTRNGGAPSGSSPSYSWVFGDGGTATGPTPSHVYQLTGTYTVVLTITDNGGQSSTSQRIVVAPAPGQYSAPTAVFTAPSGRERTPVSFDASHSLDPNSGGTLSYRWDFGDAGVAAGVHATHTFRVGTWKVTLTVTDDVSAESNSVSHTVTIVDEAPTAAFVAPVGAAGRAVSFTGAATDRDGSIRRYRWSFGDGTHGSGRSPSHTYKRRGTYRATLTVTDSTGQKRSVSRVVTIGAANACVVTSVRGDTLSQAARVLQAAHCTLGRVTGPAPPTKSPGHGRVWTRVVARQKPSAPRLEPAHFAVAVTVGYVARPA